MRFMGSLASPLRKRFIVWSGTHQTERTQLWTRTVTLRGLHITNVPPGRLISFRTLLAQLQVRLVYICFLVWMIVPTIAIRIASLRLNSFLLPKNSGHGENSDKGKQTSYNPNSTSGKEL